MGRILESTRVSLDGVIGNLQAWGMDYLDADAQRAAAAQLSKSDAMLMGRNTYQALSTAWSTREGEFAEKINAIRKYVVSSTLQSTKWKNSTILSGDVITEVARLKEQHGQDLMIYGHGPLGQALLEHGLLDEVRLSVHPIIVGAGTLFFRDAQKKTRLELVGSEPLPSGVVVLTYRPAAVAGADPDQRREGAEHGDAEAAPARA